ncbi:MAG TPA: BON domain-containing protein [Ktedonobacterales bacterium]
MAIYLSPSQRAGEASVDTTINEYARILLQLGKPFNGERVAGIPAAYRNKAEGVKGQVKRLWLSPQSGQVTMSLSIRKSLLGKSDEILPLSAGAAASPSALQSAIELQARMPVFCTDEHQQARYRVGQFEGLTVAARTGLANGLVVQVRAHPEADITRPTDPQAALVSVAGRRLVLSPAWVKTAKQGELLLSVFPAQVASGVEYLDDLQVRERIWAILGENPALQPYLASLRIDVHDGVVYLGGRLPMLRLRNSAKQDIWHVPGVVAIEDTLRID